MPTESHVEFFEDTVLGELRLDLGSSVMCLNVGLDMWMCGALEMCRLTEMISRLLTYVIHKTMVRAGLTFSACRKWCHMWNGNEVELDLKRTCCMRCVIVYEVMSSMG